MNLGFFLSAVLFFLLVSEGCSTRRTNYKTRDELMQIDRAFSGVSQTKGAAEAFVEFMAPGGTSLPAGGEPVHGLEAIRQSLTNLNGVLRWQPAEAEVAASGDLGYTWGLFEFEGEDPDGQPRKSRGKYVTVWKRQADRSWKAVLDCGNASPPSR